MATNQALENAVQKIYEQIAETGQVTDNQLMLLAIYQKQNKPNDTDQLINSGTRILTIVDKFMGGK